MRSQLAGLLPPPWRRRIRSVMPRRRSTPLEYVFVVTYGRSGSTLVQGLLNTLPGVLVRGENGFYVLSLYRAMATATTFRAKHARHQPRRVTSAFYGVHEVSAKRFVAMTRNLMVQTLLGGERRNAVEVLGFKEVLWHEVTPEETEGFFAFFDKVFPGARYVLNSRDHEDVLASGFWRRRDDDEGVASVRRVEEIQSYLRQSRPDRVHDTVYEALTSEDPVTSDAALRDLATFVRGRCDEELLEALRETRKTGYGPRALGVKRRGSGARGQRVDERGDEAAPGSG